MRKKKLWKQKCAMGLAVAVTATSVPTPALAGKAEVPVANETQVEGEDTESESGDVATSSDADVVDDTKKQEDKKEKEEKVSKATASDAEENDGEGDLIDDVTVPDKEQKATSSDADLEEPEEKELLSANQIQLSAQAGQNLNQGATIDVWDGMTEEELKEELKREVWGGVDADFPDTWYYHASATTLGRQTTDWVELGGETLNKKLRLSVQSVTYSSLMDVAVSGSATSFEIGIGAARTTKTYAGKEYVETSIADGEYATVKIRKEIKVAYTEPDETENHGTLVGEKTAKLRQKFTFKITPQVGWVPEVSVSNASASSIDVSVIRDGDQYVYTIAGDDITEDLEVEISYQADRANVETITLDSNTRDNFTVKYGSSEVTGDAFDINKTAREISIKAKDGYFLASVNGNTDLSEDDFSNDGWMTYTIADGESTISVETLKAEFVTNANPWLAWETDDSVDEDTAGKVLDAVLDWTKTLPGETVISKDQVTVEYLMGTGAATGSKSYKELTYEIKGADSYLYKGAHNFGADTETVRITWNGSKRYPKLELELELALRPDRSNKDIVTIKTATRDAIQIQYKDATVTDDELLLDKDNHEIKISAKDGYYLESVDGTMLGDSDFTAAHVYEYTVPDGATELSVSVKKMSFEAKQDPTLNWYEGKEIDESTAQKIIEAVVDWTGTVPDESVIDKEDLKVEYAASDMPESSLYSPYKSLDHDPGVNFLEHEFGDKTSEKIRITWNGTNQYRKMVLEVTLNLEDTRLETSVTLNSGVKVTYVPEDQEETFKRAVYEQVISKVDPLAEKPAYEKFKIVNNTKTLLTPDYNVGTKEVQVTYLGDDTYKSSKATVQVEIVKAKSSIRVKQLYTITYGQEIQGEYIVTNPEGLKVLAIYAGVNSDFDGTIMFNVPKITVAGMDVDLESIIRTIFPDGASISDVLEFLNSDASQTVLKLLEQAGIDTSSFIQALETISKYLPDSVTSLRVQFGTPNRAGMYATVAIVADQNYESSVGVGSLIIKPETQDVRLVWKNNVTTIAFNDRPATDEEAEKLFEAGIYVSDQEQVNPTTEVRYSYKGTSLAGVYYDMATPVLDPGTYTQTAYIRNGDQLAWPISREYTVELSDSQIRFDDLDEDGTKTVFYNGQPQGLTAQLYYGKDFDQKCENAELHYTYNGSYTVPTDAGIYEVVAGFNGDGWHKIAPHVTAILIINKVTPQIAITPAEYTYDGQAHSAEYQVTGIDGEELAGVEATVTYTNMETGATSQDAPTEVGTYHVTVTVKDSKNYGANSQTAEQALVIKKAELQGTSVEITDLEHVYDGNVHKASVSVTGVADEQIDDYTVTYLDEAGEVVENPINAGTYKVIVKVSTANYEDYESPASELVIKKAELQGTSVEITDLEHVYDGNVHKASVSVTGVADEQIDDYTVTYLDEAGEVVENPINAGTYKVIVKVSTANYEDYESPASELVIKKAVLPATSIEASDLVVDYDGNAHEATISAKGILGEDLPYEVTYQNADGDVVEKPVEVGSYTVVVVVNAPNYECLEQTYTLQICDVTPSVVVENVDVVYDGNAHEAKVTVAGVDGSAKSATISYRNQQTGEVSEKAPVHAGTYDVIVVTETSGHQIYEHTEIGAIVIRQAKPSLRVIPFQVTYDGDQHPAYCIAEGVHEGDVLAPVTVTYNGSEEVPVHAGTYDVTAVIEATQDYERVEVTVAEAVMIAKAEPSIQIGQVTTVYDGSAHTAEYSVLDKDGEPMDVETTVWYGDSTEAPVHAGTYDVTVQTAETQDYKSVTVVREGAVVITPVETASVRVIPFQITYDGRKHPAYCIVSGLEQGTYKLKVTYNGSEEVPTEAGRYEVVVVVETDGDYAVAPVTVEDAVIIAKAEPQIRLAKAEYTYDGEAHPASYEVIGVDDEPLSVETEVLYNESAEAPVEAGSYTVSIKTIETTNYSSVEVILEDGIVINPKKDETETPDKPGTGEGGEETPDKPGTGEGGEETPDRPGTGEGGEETPDKPGTGDNGNGGSDNGNSGTDNSGSDNTGSDNTGSGSGSSNSGSSSSGGSSSRGSGSSRPATSTATTTSLPAGEWKLDENGIWYYVFTEGSYAGQTYKGWLKDSKDGYWYYLDPVTGAIAIGWVQIDGKWYYFNPIVGGGSGWTYNSETQKWEYQVTVNMPMGAMYANATTPDGYQVDADGVCQ